MTTENKKSKARFKREEKELKQDFITRAYSTVLAVIPVQTQDGREKLKVQLTHTNYNRYIKFTVYGKSLNIQIFGDGNVTVELEEFCHNKYTEVLFEYSSNKKEQEDFLHRLEGIAAMLIKEFRDGGVLDWHSYMDYVWDVQNVDAAWQKMMKEYNGYEEGADESEQSVQE